MARWSLSLMFLVGCAAAAWLPGCAWRGASASGADRQTELVIPDFRTAKEQYSFATAYQQAQVISPDQKKRQMQVDKISQCYERVIRNFPDDPSITPLAYLALGDCQANLGRYARAREMYSDVMRRYPSNEFVQARGLFSIGKAYDRSGEYQQAKDTYRQVMERFGRSENPTVRDIVKRADSLYYKVQEKPK